MKPVYNGYDEQFLNGKQLKEFFEDCFLQTKHKQTCVLNMTIDEYLTFFNIEDDKLYRIFVNGAYCRLSDGETDKEISFFAFIPKRLFNQFEKYVTNNRHCLECSNHPKCKYKKHLYIIGKEN